MKLTALNLNLNLNLNLPQIPEEIKIRSKIKIKICGGRDLDIQRQSFGADRALDGEQLGDFAGFAAQVDGGVDRTRGAWRQDPWVGRHGGFSAAARALQIGDDDRVRGSVCRVKNESGSEFAGLGVEVFGIGVPGEDVGAWRDCRSRRLLGRGQHDAGEE